MNKTFVIKRDNIEIGTFRISEPLVLFFQQSIYKMLEEMNDTNTAIKILGLDNRLYTIRLVAY